MSERQLGELFSPFGNPTVVLPDSATPSTSAPASTQQPQLQTQVPTAASPQCGFPSSCLPSSPVAGYHAFLEFKIESDAAAAAAAVPRNGPWAAAGGRKVVLSYAEVRQNKVLSYCY